jgi:hypothetical protein
LVLGWLLGTLSPGIGRAILRANRRKDLLRSLTYECGELRFTVANVLFSSRKSLRELDQAVLDLVKPVLLNYAGREDDKLVATMRQLFIKGDAAVLQWANDSRSEKKDQFGRPLGHWPAIYATPLLSSHIGDLDLFLPDQRERFLRVEAELRLFNEQVQYVRMQHDRTFTATGSNLELTESNLLSARRNFGTRCEVLIRVINRAIGPEVPRPSTAP